MRSLIENAPQRLLWIVLFFVLLIAGYLIYDNYNTQIKLIQERELARLEGISGSLALLIDGDAHRKLMMRHEGMDAITSNEDDSVYNAIHNLLKQARDVHSIESSIYTMVYEPTIDKFCFLVTSSDDPTWKHAYRDYPPEMLKNYEQGGSLDMYTDSKGTWLSAFYPIRTSKGETAGILQVDERFDDFLKEAQLTAFRNISISGLVALVILVILIIVLRRILAEMDRLRREKEELDTLRKELLANVSHDLRTPLASILGYLETVSMMPDLPLDKRQNYLETALQSTEKLKRLIDELFDLSKLESRDRKPLLEPFSISELASDIASGLRITADKNGISLIEEVPRNLPAVQADIALIDRVLQNLVSNAIKFTPKGGQVTLKLVEMPNHICVDVIDTGVGIAKEDLAKVFERFTTTSSGERKGSGLGLAIVKTILEAHDAEYSLTSEVNKGSHFRFKLIKA